MSRIHHQILFFPPLRCSARPLCQFPLVASCLLIFLPSIYCFNFNFINWKACYIEWKLTWPFLCLDKLLDCFPSILWIVIHLHCGALSDQFCTMIALAPIHVHAVTLLTPYLKNLCGMLLMRCPFPSQNICVFPPENWASKAFFKIYFEAKSAIILSSFNQTWLVFQYTHSLNEILKRWLPSGVILFNFIKKATVTSFILYKVTTANIKERIPKSRWIPLLACAWWQWEGRTLSGGPTFCLTGRGWWEGDDRIEKRSLSLFQHEHTAESAPAYS